MNSRSARRNNCSIAEWLSKVDTAPIELVPVGDILPGQSPRLGAALNREYVQHLAEVVGPLPAIIVHRHTRKLIDGRHRLEAARMRCRARIAVKYFDGSEEDVFALSVHMNVLNGLALSLAERKAAADRLVSSHPYWSDRLIAGLVGLSNKTVAVRRRRVTGQNPQLHGRLGRDGKVRPADVAERRRIAAKAIMDNPSAPLREISRIAGVSTGTVRDVRSRLGQSGGAVENVDTGSAASKKELRPDPFNARSGYRGVNEIPNRVQSAVKLKSDMPPKSSQDSIMYVLRRDPALRFSEMGRMLLRKLSAVSEMNTDTWEEWLFQIPPHCIEQIAALARANAKSWGDLARRLENNSMIAELNGTAGNSRRKDSRP